MKFRGTVLIPFRVKSLSVTALRLSAAAGAWLIVVFMAHPVLADVANQLLPVQTVPTSSLIGEKTASLMFGLFIGVMLTATLYLFFIWVILRDRGQVFLMLLLLCLGVSMASTNDQLTDFIGLRGEIILNLVQNYGMILSYVFSIFFTYYFLEIDVYEPRLTSALFGLAIVLLAFLGYAVFDPRSIHFIMPTLGTVAIAAVLTAGIVAMRNGVSGSLMHIVAFSFFLLGGIIEPLYSIGFIADPQTARNLGYASYSYAALLFAVVIATQFAARQEEKERALAVSNERFILAAQGSNEGLFDWNLVTGEVFFSDQFRKILDIPLEHNVHGLKAWGHLIPRVDRAAIFMALHRFRKTPQNSSISFEYRLNRPNKKSRWMHTKAVATRDAETGKIMRFVGSIGDITARKRSETELKASETRFRSITEAHPVPVLIARIWDTQMLYASPGAEDLLGMPHETLTDNLLNRFIGNTGELNEITEAMNAGRAIKLKEVTITRGDGVLFPAALSARRINYQNEAAMVIGLYDLTERKHAEEQIERQQEALLQSEKMAALGGLLAGVAHELNNPLSVVAGQSTLLMEGSEEPKVKSRAEKIFKAADRCSRIVKSFLALARRKPPERKPVDLNGVINTSLELLEYQFRNHNIAVKLELADGLPNIMGDNDQMAQVFTNLGLNAAQAMQNWQGNRHLTIRTETEGDLVQAIVQDTGPGIPADIKARVFEPFFTTKGTDGGTGVGLSLCLNIVENHGGHLRIEDTEGGGATFVISLPAEISSGNSDTAGNEAHENAVLRKLKLLLVDDEVELAQTLADLLEPEGHDVSMAANGAIALDKLRKEDYDVIISDLRMPVLDGIGLYAELQRSMPRYLRRIIYVTGDTLSQNVQSFLGSTPVPVIEKPYRLASVRNAVAALLKDNELRGSM